jgi:hypothetical protein
VPCRRTQIRRNLVELFLTVTLRSRRGSAGKTLEAIWTKRNIAFRSFQVMSCLHFVCQPVRA